MESENLKCKKRLNQSIPDATIRRRKKRVTPAFYFLIPYFVVIDIILFHNNIEPQFPHPNVESSCHIVNHLPEKSKACAVVLFGLPRLFQEMVLPSLKEFVFPHTSHCDIYIHTYNVTQLTNPRDGEFDVTVDIGGIHEINATKVLVDDPAMPETRINFKEYHEYSAWPTVESLDNMFRQWYSIERGWDLIEASGVKYEHVAFLRSDVFYATPLPDNIWNQSAAIPSFAMLPENDRMFVGSYENARIWATDRFSNVDKNLLSHYRQKKKPLLHSETFMKEVIVSQFRDLHHFEFCFFRVRGTGRVRSDDCWCGSPQNLCSYSPKNSIGLVHGLTGLNCAANGRAMQCAIKPVA